MHRWAPPYHERRDPPATVFTSYPGPNYPTLWIVIGGEWVRCRALRREDRGPRIVYHVEVPVRAHGLREWRRAVYWWDPRCIQPEEP